MSLVKKNRIDHFKKNKKNHKKETKRIQAQQRQLTVAMKSFAEKKKA